MLNETLCDSKFTSVFERNLRAKRRSSLYLLMGVQLFLYVLLILEWAFNQVVP
jgi:hypothetical protein